MLQKIDYKILFELDSNSRQSYSEIAKKIGTSKQVVLYHTNELIKQKYIHKFLTIFDLSKLGFILHKVYLRLIKATEKDEIEILRYLQHHQNVAWLVRTEGIYDLAFALHTKDILELNKFLTEFEDKYGNFISEKVINRVVTGEFFHRDYFLEHKTSGFRKNVIFQTNEQKINLDNIDWEIMIALSRNARTTAVDIAKKVPITADAVGKRIKNLESTGVIKNYILVPNDEKIDQIHYKVLMRVTHFETKIEKKFLEFCRQQKNTTFYNKNIGSWEIEIDIEVKTSEEFRHIMRTLKKEFSEIIKEYFSLIVYEVVKFDFIPMNKFG